MSQPPSLGLNTSKRKFYKLLDNLSSSQVHLPSETPTSTPVVTESPNKRFRLLGKDKDRPTTAPSHTSRPFSFGRERPRSSIVAVNNGSSTKPSGGLSKQQSNTEEKPPNYAPWNHEQFLARLKTFADVKTWTPKPPAIGEIEWAKRGWIVVAKDTVGCKGGCERRLLVQIADEENKNPEVDGEVTADDDDWWTGDLERELVKRYHGLIVDGHTDECFWKRAGCKEDIYRIKMADPATWQKELRVRYLSLLSVEASLPAALNLHSSESDAIPNLDVLELVGIIPSQILARPKQPSSETSEESAAAQDAEDVEANVNMVALGMALLGWSGQYLNSVQLACCNHCFQRAGLWLYKPRPTSATRTNADVVGTEDLVFDPIDQHREHCPWRNSAMQCAHGSLQGLAGWQVLVTLIKGHQRHDKAPRKAASRPLSLPADFNDEDITKTAEDQDREDKERRSRLQRLKRAFTVHKGSTVSRRKSQAG